MSKKLKLSPLRKFMLWLFGSPSNDPYLKANIDIEFDNALNFLKEYNKISSVKISINHLIIKALADTFAKNPRLNVKIFGGDIYELDSVNIATPINLIGNDWEENKNELGLTIVKDADKKTLEEISRSVTKDAKKYKQGKNVYLFEEFANLICKTLPDFSLKLFFKGVSIFGKNRYLYEMLQDFLGVTTLITNIGSVINKQEGIHYKTLTFTIPDTLVYFSTCFGAGPLEKKAVVGEDDKIVVKSLIPFLMIFDHRVIDGFLINQFVEDFAKIIMNPDKYYSVNLTKYNQE